MLMDPHPSQQHEGLHDAVLPNVCYKNYTYVMSLMSESYCFFRSFHNPKTNTELKGTNSK